MDDHQATQEDLLRSLIARSKSRKRIKKRFPILTFNRKTLQLLGVQERQWRGRKVPRDAETRQLLLTGYLGFVVRNEPFLSWARYLRATFPDFKPEQGDAIDFCIQQLEQRGLLHAYCEGKIKIEDALRGTAYEEYNERRRQDYLGTYDSISSRAVLQQSPLERRYLCSRCGLHFLATALFASASYGPRLTHQLVWNEESWWIMGQTELGVYAIPGDATGHGRAGMWLATYEQLEGVTARLFSQQINHETPQTLAQQFKDTPLRLTKELQRARQVLGMHRRKGNQASWWNRSPTEPCKNCTGLMR